VDSGTTTIDEKTASECSQKKLGYQNFKEYGGVKGRH